MNQSTMKTSGILKSPNTQRRIKRVQKAKKAIKGNIQLICSQPPKYSWYLLSQISNLSKDILSRPLLKRRISGRNNHLNGLAPSIHKSLFFHLIRMSPPKITMIRIASIKDWAPTNQYDGRLSFMNPRSRPIQSITQKVIPLNPSSLLPVTISTQNAMNGIILIVQSLLYFWY